MINGQLNMNMLEAVALPVSSRLPTAVAATTDGALQVSSDFAELLHDIQLMTKEKVTLASETEDTALVDVITKHLLDVESVSGRPAVDLPGRLQADSPPMSASEPTAAKREDNVEVQAEAAPLGINQSSIISQMALTMYSQTGRMPEVNIPTKLTVDTLQNVATEQSASIAAPTVKMDTEQTLSVSTQATALKPSMINKPVASTGAEQNQHQQLGTPSPATAEKHAITTATTAAQVTAPPATSDRTSNAGKPQTLAADRFQKVAAATEQPALTTAPLAGTNDGQTSLAPVKEPVAATGAEQNQHKQIETGRTTTTDKQTTTTLTTAARTESTTVRPVLSDRTSEVNKPPALPVDRQQNVANKTERPAFIEVPLAMSNPEQAVVPPIQTTTAKTAIDLTKEPLASTGAEQNRHRQTEMIRITAVGKQPAAAVTAGTGPTAIQPAEPSRMTEVSIIPVHSADRLQKAAPTVEQPGASDTGTVVEKEEPTLEDSVRALAPMQKTVSEKQVTTFDTNQRQQTESAYISDVEKQPVADKATSTTAISMSDESVATQGLKATVVPATAPTEKQVASLPPQTERLSLQNSNSYSPTLSPESELDIQMSQARPITAIVATAAAFADTRSAVPGRQQLSSEQQIEKIRTGNEKSVLKEMTPSLQITAPTGESMGSYDSSGDGEMNQGQSDTASDNLMLAQNMRGQFSMENQKVAADTKPAFSEPVRKEIPDQVLQQVKERLVQHDLKPGNQQITLTLSPENLGELKMNLNLQGQKLSVEIVTENRAVRDAIILHTDALKESLARQNITMESFDVTTGGKGSGGQGQNHNAWRELAKQQQQQHLWTSPRGYNTAQADLPSSQTLHRQQGQSMLDIHY